MSLPFRFCGLVAALLLSFLLLGGCDEKKTEPAAAAAKVRIFTLADTHADGYPTVLGDLKFAELVKQRTNGAVVIRVRNNAELGAEPETLQQTQKGAIQFIRIGTNVLSSVNPEINALSMPYLYRDAGHMFRVLDGEIGSEFLVSMYKDGLLGLCWFDAGSRSFYNSRREIRKPSDLAGMKIRVQDSDLMLDLVRAVGAEPASVAFNDLYAALRNNVIDGAENNWPSYMTQKHSLAAPYFTEDNHQRSPEMILVSAATWEKFSEEEKKILKESAMEAARFQREEWARQEADYRRRATAGGVTVTTLTDEEFNRFVEAVKPIYQKPAYSRFSDIARRIRETQ
ncbi:MAG: TRAP transporter substrate-binding protein [Desulfovibrio sp.]|jgi:tripartite ATP-independent transporter DctP family solute receptor|nr:TRAP transporter substrate-binding protein [Desulfovibrio sp.]